MTLAEALDGVVSNYYYCKYMGMRKYVYYLLRYVRPVNTKQLILDVTEYTKRFKHKYTFFITGVFIKKHPEIVKKLYEMGHEIGYHSYRHISSLSRNDVDFEKDILLGKEIFDVLGIPLKGYRAPHLLFDESHYSILKKAGLRYSSSKYFANSFYQVLDGLFEVPVNFIDMFDFDPRAQFKQVGDKFLSDTICLYHPYGLLAKKYKDNLGNLFTSTKIPFVTINELLDGSSGMCLTIDIGL